MTPTPGTIARKIGIVAGRINSIVQRRFRCNHVRMSRGEVHGKRTPGNWRNLLAVLSVNAGTDSHGILRFKTLQEMTAMRAVKEVSRVCSPYIRRLESVSPRSVIRKTGQGFSACNKSEAQSRMRPRTSAIEYQNKIRRLRNLRERPRIDFVNAYSNQGEKKFNSMTWT